MNEALEVTLEDEEQRGVLGLRWIPHHDVLTYRIKPTLTQPSWTKRQVVAQIGQLFDPNGFAAPVIITAKILIQGLWKLNLDWDDHIPPQQHQQWQQYLEELNQMDIRIPRWLGTKTDWNTEIHLFSDASERAYAACAYARTIDSEGNITVHLIQSKTRVAPVKAVTIPRLELCGCLLAVTLLEKVRPAFSDISNIFLWTDSLTVLRWLGKSPAQLKTFIANRVAEIQEKTTLPGYKWRWTPGKENPADLASRGISPSELPNQTLWWNGPVWLSKYEYEWPLQPATSLSDDDDGDPEIRPLVHNLIIAPNLERGPWYQHKIPAISTPLMDTYSDFNKLHGTMGYIQRACNNFRSLAKHQPPTIGPLSVSERRSALLKIIQMDQAQHMKPELHIAMGAEKSKSQPEDGTKFYDQEAHVLRYFGRVKSDNLSYDEQYPILLSPKSRLTKLLLTDAHKKNPARWHSTTFATTPANILGHWSTKIG